MIYFSLTCHAGIEILLYADDTAIILCAANNELLQISINKFVQQYCK